MTDQLSILRRAFDERVTALETALADPEHGAPLETLVLDLVRIAGDEADAAAHDIVLGVRRDANAQVAGAMADTQQAHLMLDAERTLTASLRGEIATLKGHLSAAISARQSADAAREHDITELQATIARFQQRLDEAQQAVTESASSVTLAQARADAAIGEREAAMHEREAAMHEREDLLRARDALAAERDSLLAGNERLMNERAEFVRAHDALALQRDTLAHERDEIVRERNRELSRVLGELKAAREAARERAAAPPPVAAPTPKAAAKSGPIRQADRQAFTSALGVQIDGEAALLVDLSLTGAQVLSCAALKPAKTVKMLLPSSESPVLCRGRIVWARLEPTQPGRPIRYRAGMFFTATDQAAVQTFITRHGAHAR